MSSGIDKLLEQLDDSLKDKKEVEVYTILFIIFLGVAGLSYTYLFPLTETMLQESQTKKDAATKKLEKTEKYLADNFRNNDQYYFVNEIKKDIVKKKVELADLKKDSEYVDNKLKKLRHLLYDNENWSKFIDSISMYANIHTLKLNSIDSKVMDISEAQSQLKQVLDIYVNLDGSYQNILKFINDIEQSKLVVDLYDFEILTTYYIKESKSSKDKTKLSTKYPINSILKISVWGMLYDGKNLNIPKPEVEAKNGKKNSRKKR